MIVSLSLSPMVRSVLTILLGENVIISVGVFGRERRAILWTTTFVDNHFR